DGDSARRLVVASAGDDAFRIRYDRAIVKKDVDPALRRQESANVALEREIRLTRALDGFDDLGIRRMNQVANLTADGSLPCGERFDVRVDARVGLVVRH